MSFLTQVHYNHGRSQGIARGYRWASAPQCTGEVYELTYPSQPNYVQSTGRLAWQDASSRQYNSTPLNRDLVAASRRESFEYDEAGNLVFSTQSYRTSAWVDQHSEPLATTAGCR